MYSQTIKGNPTLTCNGLIPTLNAHLAYTCKITTMSPHSRTTRILVIHMSPVPQWSSVESRCSLSKPQLLHLDWNGMQITPNKARGYHRKILPVPFPLPDRAPSPGRQSHSPTATPLRPQVSPKLEHLFDSAWSIYFSLSSTLRMSPGGSFLSCNFL
jgi:hypothetical protein